MKIHLGERSQIGLGVFIALLIPWIALYILGPHVLHPTYQDWMPQYRLRYLQDDQVKYIAYNAFTLNERTPIAPYVLAAIALLLLLSTIILSHPYIKAGIFAGTLLTGLVYISPILCLLCSGIAIGYFLRRGGHPYIREYFKIAGAFLLSIVFYLGPIGLFVLEPLRNYLSVLMPCCALMLLMAAFFVPYAIFSVSFVYAAALFTRAIFHIPLADWHQSIGFYLAALLVVVVIDVMREKFKKIRG